MMPLQKSMEIKSTLLSARVLMEQNIVKQKFNPPLECQKLSKNHGLKDVSPFLQEEGHQEWIKFNKQDLFQQFQKYFDRDRETFQTVHKQQMLELDQQNQDSGMTVNSNIQGLGFSDHASDAAEAHHILRSLQLEQFDISAEPKHIKIITGEYMERACGFLKAKVKRPDQSVQLQNGLKEHEQIRICELAKCVVFKEILSIVFWLYVSHLQRLRSGRDPMREKTARSVLEKQDQTVKQFEILLNNHLYWVITNLHQSKDVVLEVMPLVIAKAVCLILEVHLTNSLDEIYRMYGNKAECQLFVFQFAIHKFNGSIELPLSTIDKMVEKYMSHEKQKDWLMVLYDAHHHRYETLIQKPDNIRKQRLGLMPSRIMMFDSALDIDHLVSQAPTKDHSRTSILNQANDFSQTLLQVPRKVKFGGDSLGRERSKTQSPAASIEAIREDSQKRSSKRSSTKQSSEPRLLIQASSEGSRESSMKSGGRPKHLRRDSSAGTFQLQAKIVAYDQSNPKQTSLQSSFRGSLPRGQSIYQKPVQEKPLREHPKTQVQDKMKGIFKSDHLILGKFRDIDAEEQPPQPRRSLMTNEDAPARTGRSGGSFRPEGSTMTVAGKPSLQEQKSASQRLKAEKNKQNFFLKIQNKNMSSLEVQDEYSQVKRDSGMRSHSFKNNFNRYGISRYLKNIYNNNEFSIPMVSRCDSVKNAPLRLSLERRRSQARNSDDLGASNSISRLILQSDDAKVRAFDLQEDNLDQPKFWIKYLQLQEFKKEQEIERQQKSALTAKINLNSSLESVKKFELAQGAKYSLSMNKYINQEIQQKRQKQPREPYLIDQIDQTLKTVRISQSTKGRASRPGSGLSQFEKRICCDRERMKNGSNQGLPLKSRSSVDDLRKDTMRRTRFSASSGAEARDTYRKGSADAVPSSNTSVRKDLVNAIVERSQLNISNSGNFDLQPKNAEEGRKWQFGQSMQYQKVSPEQSYQKWSQSISYCRHIASVAPENGRMEKPQVPILRSLYKNRQPIQRSYKDAKLLNMQRKPGKAGKTSRFLKKQEMNCGQQGRQHSGQAPCFVELSSNSGNKEGLKRGDGADIQRSEFSFVSKNNQKASLNDSKASSIVNVRKAGGSNQVNSPEDFDEEEVEYF